MPNAPHNSVIQAIEDGLRTAGYESENFLRHLDVLTGQRGFHIDLAVFSDTLKRDVETATLAVVRGPTTPSLLNDLRVFGAPYAIIYSENEGSDFYVVKSDENRHQLISRSGTTTELTSFLRRESPRLRPQSITMAKTGFYQPSFAEIDPEIGAFAAEASQSWLLQCFKQALAAGRNDRKADDRLVNGALIVLGARTLEDKLVPSGPRQDLDPLLRWAATAAANISTGQFWTEKFRETSRLLEDPSFGGALEAVHRVLQGRIRLSLLTEESLGLLLENVLLTTDEQREAGAFVTPPRLAMRILQRLPVEWIPPQDRVLLDPSCGSGNLLIAGLRRLKLADMTAAPGAGRLNNLVGVENDGIAYQLAEISLLVASLEESGSARLIHGDFLQLPDEVVGRPSIVIANPPFHGEKKQIYFERAVDFLVGGFRRLRPGGLLAFVLPRTITVTRAGSEARKMLLKQASLLEMWELPAGIFSSNVETVVLFAQKHEDSSKNGVNPTRLLRVRRPPEARRKFLEEGSAGAAWLVPDAGGWKAAGQFVSSPLDQLLERIVHESPKTIKDIAHIRNGLNFSGGDIRPLSDAQSMRAPIRVIRRSPRKPFIEIPDDALSEVFDLESKASWAPRAVAEELRLPKILVSSTRAASSPWRFVAFAQPGGLVPAHSFYAVIPNSPEDFDYLLCLLNSTVVNAFVSRRVTTRWLQAAALSEIPLPPFPQPLREAAPLITRMAREGLLAAAYDRLDEAIAGAFSLSSGDQESITREFASYPRPGLGRRETRNPELVTEPRVSGPSCVGEVIEVDGKRQTMLTRISGLDHYGDDGLTTLTISPWFPGWLLRPGVLFVCQSAEIMDSKPQIARLHPHEASYLSQQSVISELNLRTKSTAEVAHRLGGSIVE